MSDLPQDRLLPDEPPFTNVCVDFFSPFDIKRGRTKAVRRDLHVSGGVGATGASGL